MDKLLRAAIALLLAMTGAFAVTAMACGDDDGDGVEVIDGEPDPVADPEAEPDPEAHEAEDITPRPKPDAARQIDVTLAEYSIAASATSVPAGEVYFLVENEGPNHAHELVVLRTDLAADALPVEDGLVSEDADGIEELGEIEPFAVGSTGSLTLDLEPGNYVLICNIAEEEHGEIESHYEEGMRTTLTVQ